MTMERGEGIFVLVTMAGVVQHVIQMPVQLVITTERGMVISVPVTQVGGGKLVR